MEAQKVGKIIEEISGDTTSGAAELVLKSLSCLENLTNALLAGTVSTGGARTFLRELSTAKVEMVPIGNLVAIFEENAGSFSGEELRAGLEKAKAAVEEETHIPNKIFEKIAPFFKGGEAKILVYSYSSVVCSVLTLLGGETDITVLTSEGRPTGDGDTLMKRLGKETFRFILFTDAGLLSSVEGADMAFLGTDGWSENYFLNKMGTKALVQLLDLHGKQAFVFASPLKKTSDALLLSTPSENRSAREITSIPEEGVTVKNHYFEVVPRYPNVTVFGGGKGSQE